MKDVFPQLPNPPIKEAVIDVQFAEPLPLEALYGGPIEGFGAPSTVQTSQIAFRNDQGLLRAEGDPESEMRGFRYDSEDNTFVVQILRERLAVSRLAPYSGWQELVDKTRQIWGLYLEPEEKLQLSRLAVRYINALEVPFGDADSIDFSRYIRNTPTVPEGYEGEVENFFSRFVVRARGCEGAKVNIIQTFNELPDARGVELILDIDAYSEFQSPPERSVWELLEELRAEKNHIFYNTMTKSALGLCQ
jgi:uncharacterized protein (TIGR04255 family)